jgi:hypothetical protein
MRRLVTVFAAVLSLLPCVVLTADPAYAVCSETYKFVEALNSGGYIASQSYAAKSELFAWGRSIGSSCGSVANTQFMMLNGSSDYVEAGTRQYYSSDTTWKPFCEYRDYPADSVYTELNTPKSDNQWVWMRVYTPTSGTTWRCAYSFDGTNYTIISTTSALLDDHGTPVSEISRYGGTAVDASATVTNLQRYTSDGFWRDWTDIRCSTTFQNSINDWNAHFTSSNSWESVHNPVAGPC